MNLKRSLKLMGISVLIISLFNTNSNGQTRPMRGRPTFIERFNRIDTTERTGVFISYPTNFVASTLKVGYEFKVAHNKGLKLIGSFGSSNNTGDFYGVDNFNEFGLEAQLRFYVLKDRPALNGLYLAPYVFYKSMNYQTSTSNYDINTGISVTTTSSGNVSNTSIGYIIGYQYIYNSTLTIDAFVGGGDDIISGDNSAGSLSATFAYRKGIDLHTGIGIGIAF